MKPVRLIFAVAPHQGETVYLEKTSKGLVVRDEDGEVVTKIPNGEVSTRVHFPSFWASVSFLMLEKEDGTPLQFQPKPKTLAAVRKLVEACINTDPRATAATYRRKAIRDFIVGTVTLVLGAVITVAMYLVAPPRGTFILMTGLLVAGLAEIIRAIYFGFKAVQHARAAPEDQ